MNWNNTRLDIQNDIHDTKTRKKYFIKKRKV